MTYLTVPVSWSIMVLKGRGTAPPTHTGESMAMALVALVALVWAMWTARHAAPHAPTRARHATTPRHAPAGIALGGTMTQHTKQDAAPVAIVKEALQEGKEESAMFEAVQYHKRGKQVIGTTRTFTNETALARLDELRTTEALTKANECTIIVGYDFKAVKGGQPEPANKTQLAERLAMTRTTLYQHLDVGAHDFLHQPLAAEAVNWNILVDIGARLRRKECTVEEAKELALKAVGATEKEYKAMWKALKAPAPATQEPKVEEPQVEEPAPKTETAARDAVLANLLQLAPEDREHVLSEAMHTLPLPAMRRLAAIAKTAAAKANAPTAPALGEDAPTAPAGEDLVS
jgi:hypothetical protein